MTRPTAVVREQLARAVMEIEMPERVDVLDLEAAYLELLEAFAIQGLCPQITAELRYRTAGLLRRA